uniref:Uncharacterized protein n=1 Tax=Heterorhabditis bacteriophora TaxID=37862 RepID=A0A1I7WVZ8_HETBA
MVMGERLHAGFGGVPGPLEREFYAPYNTHRDEDWVRSREYSIGGQRSHSPQRKFLYGVVISMKIEAFIRGLINYYPLEMLTGWLMNTLEAP